MIVAEYSQFVDGIILKPVMYSAELYLQEQTIDDMGTFHSGFQQKLHLFLYGVCHFCLWNLVCSCNSEQ